MRTTFDVLILLGRPASGKSEIIAFLEGLPARQRRERYHLARLDILDDFPMLWTWFEEDDILSRQLGQTRLHTDDNGYFFNPEFWNVLIHRINLDYQKHVRDQRDYHGRSSTLVEFARGSQHGGYAGAFAHLSTALLERAAVLYVNVPFEESLRKNRLRFNPQRPDSILQHALPDSKLETLYRLDDWREFSQAEADYLHLAGLKVPYAVFENEDDVTTGQPEKLAARLETCLESLWGRYGRSQD